MRSSVEGTVAEPGPRAPSPSPAAGPSTRAVVSAILIATLILAATLVAIDAFRARRCERYGREVLAFYQQRASLEDSMPEGMELSQTKLTAALLQDVGYPPPGCALP